MNLSSRTFYAVAGIVLAVVFVLIVWLVPKWQSDAYRAKFSVEDIQKLEQKDRIQLERSASDIENSSRLTLAQILGGLVLLSGLYFTYLNVRAAQDNAKTAQENLRVTEEGKLTDRFSKAVELLGSDKLDVRLGGIYALERIARDSQKDHWTVMEVLTAFVREKSSLKTATDEASTNNKPSEDILAVLTVISRRNHKDSEPEVLDLKKVNLSNYPLEHLNLENIDFRWANFSGASLFASNLQKGRFDKADFQEANLWFASLNEAYMFNANLKKANLEDSSLINTSFFDADLSETNLKNSNMTNSILSLANVSMANFQGAILNGADLKIAGNMTLKQLQSAKEIRNIVVPVNLETEFKEWQSKPNKEKTAASEESFENQTGE